MEYMTRPNFVRAYKYDGNLSHLYQNIESKWPDWLKELYSDGIIFCEYGCLFLKDEDGLHKICTNDYIILGYDGDVSLLNEVAFERLYIPVPESYKK